MKKEELMWFFCLSLLEFSRIIKTECEKEQDVVVVLDSTQNVTSTDFKIQITALRTLISSFESSDQLQINLAVQIYYDDQHCNITNQHDVASSFYAKKKDDIESKLESLHYKDSYIEYDLECAENILKGIGKHTVVGSDAVHYFILAKYESVQEYISNNKNETITSKDYQSHLFVIFAYNSLFQRIDSIIKQHSTVYLTLEGFIGNCSTITPEESHSMSSSESVMVFPSSQSIPSLKSSTVTQETTTTPTQGTTLVSRNSTISPSYEASIKTNKINKETVSLYSYFNVTITDEILLTTPKNILSLNPTNSANFSSNNTVPLLQNYSQVNETTSSSFVSPSSKTQEILNSNNAGYINSVVDQQSSTVTPLQVMSKDLKSSSVSIDKNVVYNESDSKIVLQKGRATVLKSSNNYFSPSDAAAHITNTTSLSDASSITSISKIAFYSQEHSSVISLYTGPTSSRSLNSSTASLPGVVSDITVSTSSKAVISSSLTVNKIPFSSQNVSGIISSVTVPTSGKLSINPSYFASKLAVIVHESTPVSSLVVIASDANITVEKTLTSYSTEIYTKTFSSKSYVNETPGLYLSGSNSVGYSAVFSKLISSSVNLSTTPTEKEVPRLSGVTLMSSQSSMGIDLYASSLNTLPEAVDSAKIFPSLVVLDKAGTSSIYIAGKNADVGSVYSVGERFSKSLSTGLSKVIDSAKILPSLVVLHKSSTSSIYKAGKNADVGSVYSAGERFSKSLSTGLSKVIDSAKILPSLVVLHKSSTSSIYITGKNADVGSVYSAGERFSKSLSTGLSKVIDPAKILPSLVVLHKSSTSSIYITGKNADVGSVYSAGERFSKSLSTGLSRLSTADTSVSYSSPFTVIAPSSSSQGGSSQVQPTLTGTIDPVTALLRDIEDFIGQDLPYNRLKNKSFAKVFFEESVVIFKKITNSTNERVESASIKTLEFIEETFKKVGKELPPNESIRLTSEEIAIEVKSIESNTFDGYKFTLPNPEENMILPDNLFERSTVNENKTIFAMSFRSLPAMRKRQGAFQAIEKTVIISVQPPVGETLSKPLTYTLRAATNNYLNYQCVYWNESSWSSEGCSVQENTGPKVTCACTHMTPFSVLMQVQDFQVSQSHQFALNMITYIGCGCSIVACLALIITYLMCGRLGKVDRNIIHINLAIAIILSNSFFIGADSVFKYKTVCFGVSIGMLYSHLAAFFWMLCEGIHVYMMIVKVFSSSRKIHAYMVIGWVVPAVIVALSAFKFHENFMRDDFCWIPTDNHVIWVFVGPACFVLVVNSIILVTTLNTSQKMSVEENEFNRLRQTARLTLILMPVFGVTWVFGILSVNEQTIIFQYIFTAVNSFQGVFIFICYCLFNNEVKREYKRVRRRSQNTSSSKSTGASDNGFSAFIHPHQKRMKGTISSDDPMVTVHLTKYDNLSPANQKPTTPANNTEKQTFTDTLTKKNKRKYSIELLQLTNGENEEDEEVSASSSLLPDKTDQTSSYYQSSNNFSDLVKLNTESNLDRSSSKTDLLSEVLTDMSANEKQSLNSDAQLKSYQV